MLSLQTNHCQKPRLCTYHRRRLTRELHPNAPSNTHVRARRYSLAITKCLPVAEESRDHDSRRVRTVRHPPPTCLDESRLPGLIKLLNANRVFNTGLGMVLVTSSANRYSVIEALEAAGETVYVVGNLVERHGGEGCVIHNMHVWDS